MLVLAALRGVVASRLRRLATNFADLTPRCFAWLPLVVLGLLLGMAVLAIVKVRASYVPAWRTALVAPD